VSEKNIAGGANPLGDALSRDRRDLGGTVEQYVAVAVDVRSPDEGDARRSEFVRPRTGFTVVSVFNEDQTSCL